jgi:hypothetical protein
MKTTKSASKKLTVNSIVAKVTEARKNTMILNHGPLAAKMLAANPNAFCDCQKCQQAG